MTNYEFLISLSVEDMAKHIIYMCQEARETQTEKLMCLDKKCYRCLKHYLESERTE